jgi:hypothetical protein
VAAIEPEPEEKTGAVAGFMQKFGFGKKAEGGESET